MDQYPAAKWIRLRPPLKRDLLRSSCKHADALLDALALRGESLGGHTTRLTQLLDRYGAAELDRAIADALVRGSPSAASVAHILDQRARARKALPVLDTVLPADPRVRDLRVTPHALDRYDELYAATPDAGENPGDDHGGTPTDDEESTS
ncbi:MAG TPA: hypothetical protein VKP02_05165 [Gemmatimonadaceae bacterium]|nr:hypothetical protein [Gemmatimonadaceae bacterium]